MKEFVYDSNTVIRIYLVLFLIRKHISVVLITSIFFKEK